MDWMRNTTLSMLTEKDMQRVHDYSLKLLWENGINIANERALALFKKHGFKVEGSQIYITQQQVEAALKTVPHHFVIHGRSSARNLDLGGDYGVCTPIGPVNVRTLDEGIRPGTLKDVENLAKIYQASDVINVNTNNGVEANDTDNNRHLLVTRAVLRHTDKPVYTRLFEYQQMHEIKRMIKKGFENQRDNKGFSIIEILSPCPTNWKMTPVQAMEKIKNENEKVFPVKVYVDKEVSENG